jgi:hypothetical protein
VRTGDVEAFGPKNLANQALVGRIQICMKKTHRYSGSAASSHSIDQVAQFERFEFCTRRVETPGHFEAQRPRDERRRSVHAFVVHAWPILPSYLDHVGEPLGGDERGPCQLVFDEGVGRDGGAVREVSGAVPSTRAPHSHSYRGVWLGGRRRDLKDHTVGGYNVGEGSAGVDSDSSAAN